MSRAVHSCRGKRKLEHRGGGYLGRIRACLTRRDFRAADRKPADDADPHHLAAAPVQYVPIPTWKPSYQITPKKVERREFAAASPLVQLPRAASHSQYPHPSRNLHQGALCKPTLTDNWHHLLCVMPTSLWAARFALHSFSVAAIT
jgi:hypothetical protein